MHKNDASQSLFTIILSTGSQELTELFVTHYEAGIIEELKYLSLTFSACLYGDVLHYYRQLFCPPLELNNISEKIINCTQWTGLGKDGGRSVGKARQCVIFPVRCTEYTPGCCFNLLSLLKAEKLVGAVGHGKRTGLYEGLEGVAAVLPNWL